MGEEEPLGGDEMRETRTDLVEWRGPRIASTTDIVVVVVVVAVVSS